MMGEAFSPLVPANAGTQIEERNRPPPYARDLASPEGAEPYDLGPGIRRDGRDVCGAEVREPTW